MALLLNEIEWGEPVLPPVSDPDFEAEAKRRAGHVADLYRRLAPSPWLREAAVSLDSYKFRHIPDKLVALGALVTSQENACRYCYGAVRSFLRIMGYPEGLISKLEREAQLAELHEKERAFFQFCRSLARSKPRPARAERDELIRLGYSPQAVAEMAFMIATGCFYNRLSTFIACPPELKLERFAASLPGKLVSLAGPVLRKFLNSRTDDGSAYALPAETNGAPFSAVIHALDGSPAAGWLYRTLEQALNSPVLPRRTKALMFAVVARSLDCAHCQNEGRRLLAAEGFSDAESEATLAALDSPRLEPFESAILAWTRDTVHFLPLRIQQQTGALRAEIGDAALLEAVGVASLANATVRLAMLLA
jgi:alkylhydroperoxidase family enzyme